VDLEALKERFLALANKPRTCERAKAAAVTAASQHNVLYASGVDQRERRDVRVHWMRLLDELASKYTHSVSASEYESDIATLQAEMNRRFVGRFYAAEHPRYHYEPGFRVSHAQKSLSVYLKHLWCLGKIERPPECPVDSVVLRKAGLVGRDTRWALVNTIEQHRLQIGLLETKAADVGLSLAEWELSAWSS
jgi:hypothetical protein